MIGKTKTKAFSYLRVSGIGQVDGDGFDRQKAAVEKYAKSKKIEIVREFREPVSGTKETLDRPALSEMIEALLSNGVKLVIVEKADRLARELIVGELILRELTKHEVKVVDASGTDLSVADGDPTKKLIRQVLSAVAEYEKTALVMKLRGARQRMKRRGERVEGRKPFGDRPGEEVALERMKELRNDELSFAAIAKKLNDEAVPTRTGKPWHGETVRGILGR